MTDIIPIKRIVECPIKKEELEDCIHEDLEHCIHCDYFLGELINEIRCIYWECSENDTS